MLLDICFGTRTSWKIMLVLAEAPGKGVSKKEIRELTKIGNKVMTKFLGLLLRNEIILSNKIGKISYYKLNLANQITNQITSTMAQEKKSLNNPDFKATMILRELIYEITNIDMKNIKKIILFGSYAKGTHTQNSDIDTAIITEKQNANEEIIITDITQKLEKRFKRKIQIHYLTEKEFSENKRKIATEIKKDGITIL